MSARQVGDPPRRMPFTLNFEPATLNFRYRLSRLRTLSRQFMKLM
jgi:hypothetical protein